MEDKGISWEELDKQYKTILGGMTELGGRVSDLMKPCMAVDPGVQTCLYMSQVKLQEVSHWLNDFMIMIRKHTEEGQEDALQNAMAKGQVRLVK